jgi:hypothetical protein
LSKRTRKQPIELPIAERPGITATDIFPTLGAIWDDIASKPFLQDATRERRQMAKYVAYRAVSEALRTISFRMNADQADTIFNEIDAELRAHDRELAAEFHGGH